MTTHEAVTKTHQSSSCPARIRAVARRAGEEDVRSLDGRLARGRRLPRDFPSQEARHDHEQVAMMMIHARTTRSRITNLRLKHGVEEAVIIG